MTHFSGTEIGYIIFSGIINLDSTVINNISAIVFVHVSIRTFSAATDRNHNDNNKMNKKR